MPYKFIPGVKPEINPIYVEAVAQELRLMNPDGPPEAPLIIEEEMRHSNRTHITVIWDEWAGIGPESRSRVIVEAYKRVRGADSVLNLSVALGLTHADAKKLGVENGVFRNA